MPISATEMPISATEKTPNKSKLNKSKENEITTTTMRAPTYHEVHEYFKREALFVADNVSYAVETARFLAYNGQRKWDCLPDWKAAADLWAVRTESNDE